MKFLGRGTNAVLRKKQNSSSCVRGSLVNKCPYFVNANMFILDNEKLGKIKKILVLGIFGNFFKKSYSHSTNIYFLALCSPSSEIFCFNHS